MQRPLCVSPMLVLLALRAHATVAASLGEGAAADPWCGLSAVLPRAVGEGAGRVPARWLSRWPAAAVQDFWNATGSSLLAHAYQPGKHPGMEALIRAVNAGRRRPTAWNEASGSIDMGLVPVEAPAGVPDCLEVGGLVFNPAAPDGREQALLEALASSKAEAWWVVPPSREAWGALGPEALRLVHRLGVSLWLDAPAQGEWGDYLGSLARLSQALARMPGWDQWVWPLCDLIQQSFQDVILHGRPGHGSTGPWAWEGRCRHPDWQKTRVAAWSAMEQALGGEGALDEILVASVLWRHDLLRP